MRSFAWTLSFPLVAGLACSHPHAAIPADADARLQKLFDDYWQLKLEESPTRATYLGDHRYDDRLEDLSETARIIGINQRKAMLKQLDAIDLAKASPANRLSADILRHELNDDITAAELPARFIPISQQTGPHITLPLLRLSQPMDSVAACRNYAARLAAFPTQVDQVIDRMREGMKRGIVAPKVIIRKALPAIEAQITEDPKQSELYQTYVRKRAPSAANASVEAAMADATKQAIDGYRRLYQFLHTEYLPACTDTVGIGHLPGGKQWYETAARLHTTTDKTPHELHQLGLDEVRRINGEMRRIMDKEGFSGSVAEFCEVLRNRPDQQFNSASEMLVEFAAVLRRSDANLPTIFGRLPKAPYELKEIEAFRAPAAPAAYYYQAPDVGSRPAYYYVNTYQPEKRPRFTMEALSYHEAMPGHHLQISLAQENKALPAFRRHSDFTVFIEGWGLYSECLGKELGGYRDDYQEFGRLTFDAWRACRLVVDTGMHYLGWTRQQAIDFMKANTALAQLDIESEIDRYIAWPGQALAYKVGQLEISRMRAEAEQKLGPKFELRSFHDELLAEGALPLDALQRRMADWLARQSQTLATGRRS
jgi:uncharacterized protein (DUF885 family)